jgi:antitoxin YefM
MITTSISDFRKDIKKYLDKVSLNFETLIINRGKDKGIVIMTLEEYNALNAYSHEMSSLRNKERLDKAIEKLSKGNTFSKDLIEE